MAQQDSLALLRRLLEHMEHGTTDQAEDVHRVPVAAYRDTERWEREMDAIFRRKPVVVATSAQLPTPGAYRALDVAGVPVLAVRRTSGDVRVFLNVCRHRGSLLCAEGLGRARRLTCPYHAWTYDLDGSLVGVPGRDTFGALDTAQLGLRTLSAEERAGLVFAVLTPGEALDLDDWLGDYARVLEDLRLADMHFYTEREVAGPNWKIAFDGYVDAYHLDKLHREGFGPIYRGNVAAADAWGPHQRIAIPEHSITELRDQPEESWPTASHHTRIHTIFPHVSIVGGPGVPTMVSQLLPGPTADRSRTIQIHLAPKPVESDDARRRMDGIADFLEHVVRDEDYATGLGIQSALASGANDSFVFGRNESCNQHFHRWVDRLIEGGPAQRQDQAGSRDR